MFLYQSQLGGFDRHPYLHSSNAEPDEVPMARSIALVAGELHARISELDNHQLAGLLTALEIEHVNRLAAAAGHVETSDEVF